VGSFLRRLDKDQARGIRLVELMYPAEELLRVNVVDTPGLNSMIDEHEQTAREYMGQADAVIWLFSAHQAGKQTEQQALELLRQYRLKTVGVLNKIDRLTDQELEQVQHHLESEFSDLVEAVIPVSARAALRALVARQEEALEQSRFTELRRVLERQLFARSRRIKREAGQMRLGEVLGRGRSRAERLLEQADHVIDQLDDLPAWIEEQFAASSLEREQLVIETSFRDVFQHGAEEVLDFVRPRRWVLGEHRASPADRDYLLAVLLDGLGQMGQQSHRRVSDHLTTVGRGLGQRLATLLEGTSLSPQLEPLLRTIEPLTRERCNLLQQQVYTRFDAFSRGFLRGGWVDRFFTKDLPHKKLKRDTIYLALTRETVDLEGELLQPLARWYGRAAPLLVDQVHRIRQEVDLLRVELDHRLLMKVGQATTVSQPTTMLATHPVPERATQPVPARELELATVQATQPVPARELGPTREPAREPEPVTASRPIHDSRNR
jgi:hypothetical protein